MGTMMPVERPICNPLTPWESLPSCLDLTHLPQLNSPLGSVATSSRHPSCIPCLSPSSPSFLPSAHLSYMVLLTSAVFSMTFLCVFFFSSTGLCAPEEHGLISCLSHSVWNPQTWAQCLAQSQPPGHINLIEQLTKRLLKL